ncbi:MAG TPA: hypothetical protein DCG28_06300 [Lachnospiraceae bacterium]|nr:hypothetical protein [Lachnospiraceae bacterium]
MADNNTRDKGKNIIVSTPQRTVSSPEPIYHEYDVPSNVVEYPAEGGNIYIDLTYGNVEGADPTVTKINIPEEINGKPVLEIDKSAFKRCTSLREVYIPKSIVNVGVWAFKSCPLLLNIKVDPDNATYSDIDGVLFSENYSTLINFPMGRSGVYDVPRGTVNIAAYAFYMCNLLNKINVPSTVANIQSHAFECCSNLISIKIDKDNAYYSDENGVLYDKRGVRLIAYPAGHSTSCVIPEKVRTIDEYAFYGCDSLRYVYCIRGTEADNKMIYPIGISMVYYGTTTTLTMDKLPSNCTMPVKGGYIYFDTDSGSVIDCDRSVSEVIIPKKVNGQSVKKIKERSFMCCRELKEVTLSKSVKTIGRDAFAGCSALNLLVSKGNVTTVAKSSFLGCTNLKNIKCVKGSALDDKTLYFGDVNIEYIEPDEKKDDKKTKKDKKSK